ncbi:MAG TPA: DoxX family membrane protein [Bacteroidia bacterium]|nr:DoxX family membrane protein [Sphingobacteriales bacterium]HPD64873.1 DoxX family membrane protein [Bacteroidia bacterium]HRS58412.1 DoxX family membrane protein [Bacteroidia bacterium]HRU67361.1 DoxX family membrane protein [Bacteroidia bacterium]
MKILGWIGRIIFGLAFMGFGINHFRKTEKIAGYIPDYIPWHTFWVYFTGIAFILAGISIAIHYKSKIAAIALAAMIFLFIVILYLPDMMSSKMAIVNYGAFIGAALFVAANSKS